MFLNNSRIFSEIRGRYKCLYITIEVEDTQYCYGKFSFLIILQCFYELHFNKVFIYPQFSMCTKNYYTVYYNHLLGNVRTT